MTKVSEGMAATRRLVTFAALPACLFYACSSSSPDAAPTATQGGSVGVAGAASLGRFREGDGEVE